MTRSIRSRRASQGAWLLILVTGIVCDAPLLAMAQEAPDDVQRAQELLKSAREAVNAGRLATGIKQTRQAVRLMEQAYPAETFPRGHAYLAHAVYYLGRLLEMQEAYDESRQVLTRALEMYRRLYPAEEYPSGHADLASSLTALGLVHDSMEEPVTALKYFSQALAMQRGLYPVEKFPRGHVNLAFTLSSMGQMFDEAGDPPAARRHLEEALAMTRRLFPADEYPQGSHQVRNNLQYLARVLDSLGDRQQARELYGEAVAMSRRLFPPDQYPNGHEDLAICLESLADSNRSLGDYVAARRGLEEALAMLQRYYPRDEFPDGHPQIAQTATSLARVLRTQGEYTQARQQLDFVLAMQRRLYPAADFPQGHHDLAYTLNQLGRLCEAQENYPEARDFSEQFLAMIGRLYPPEKHPHGHPRLAGALLALADLFDSQGDYPAAVEKYQQAIKIHEWFYPPDKFPRGHLNLNTARNNLALCYHNQLDHRRAQAMMERVLADERRLYPVDEYPHGHLRIASTLQNLGLVKLAQRDYAGANEAYQESQRMDQRLADSFFSTASEAESLNFAASRVSGLHGLISLWDHLSQPADELYAHVWRAKKQLFRVMTARQDQLQQIEDLQTRRDYSQYLDTRRQLSMLILAPAEADPRRAATRKVRVQNLVKEKESLERELARRLPDFGAQFDAGRGSPEDLRDALPARAALIDLHRYKEFQHDDVRSDSKSPRWRVSYVAFVMPAGQPVAMVKLGPAAPIDAAAEQWRRSLRAGGESDSPQVLHELVWKPLADRLPGDTQVIYVAPEGALVAIPWGALPGRAAGTILLEDLAVSFAPSGPALLDLLAPVAAANPHGPSAERVLAVADVQYDPATSSKTSAPATTPSALGLRWPALPGTQLELQEIRTLAAPRAIVSLTGAEADPAGVMRELPQATTAVFATHGFFSNPRIRSALQLDASDYSAKATTSERASTARRHPLLLSGLVLAGANRPQAFDEQGLPRGEAGVLTAEAIAAAQLRRLQLAVLSACETGLGDVASGEGVFGLHRAFHQAGARNVVGTLWRVDDQATAALMRVFYHQLWQEGQPPLAALRMAQLSVYRHPELIGPLATTRGPDFARTVKLVAAPASPATDSKRAHPRTWAGFVHSGVGQ